MENFDNNVVVQSVTKAQMNYTVMEKQLLEAKKKIAELELELEWSNRSYE